MEPGRRYTPAKLALLAPARLCVGACLRLVFLMRKQEVCHHRHHKGDGDAVAAKDGLHNGRKRRKDALHLRKANTGRERKRRNENRFYEALCYQYEQQMLAEMRDQAGFGELAVFGSTSEARGEFERFLRGRALEMRGEFSTRAQEIADNQTIERIMAAYDRTHGEFESNGMAVAWNSIDHGISLEFDVEEGRATAS